MAKKKTDETGEIVEGAETQAAETEPTETKPKRSAKKAKDAEPAAEETSLVDSVIETVTSAVDSVVDTVREVAANVASLVTGTPEKKVSRGKRAEKIGVITSDKMTNTVVVRVDRLIKHPVYRKYVRKRKKFMAHDELGSKIGDKVRIVETRPMSARKRWRVVEILHKAEL
jgi:small subunit ribosomal protein S17